MVRVLKATGIIFLAAIAFLLCQCQKGSDSSSAVSTPSQKTTTQKPVTLAEKSGTDFVILMGKVVAEKAGSKDKTKQITSGMTVIVGVLDKEGKETLVSAAADDQGYFVTKDIDPGAKVFVKEVKHKSGWAYKVPSWEVTAKETLAKLKVFEVGITLKIDKGDKAKWTFANSSSNLVHLTYGKLEAGDPWRARLENYKEAMLEKSSDLAGMLIGKAEVIYDGYNKLNKTITSGINARFTYKDKDGEEKALTVEADGNGYLVVKDIYPNTTLFLKELSHKSGWSFKTNGVAYTDHTPIKGLKLFWCMVTLTLDKQGNPKWSYKKSSPETMDGILKSMSGDDPWKNRLIAYKEGSAK